MAVMHIVIEGSNRLASSRVSGRLPSAHVSIASDGDGDINGSSALMT
jgi:hypothetical protein